MFIIFEESVSVICGKEKYGNFRPRKFSLANYRLRAAETVPRVVGSRFTGAPLIVQQCATNNIIKAFCQIRKKIFYSLMGNCIAYGGIGDRQC